MARIEFIAFPRSAHQTLGNEAERQGSNENCEREAEPIVEDEGECDYRHDDHEAGQAESETAVHFVLRTASLTNVFAAESPAGSAALCLLRLLAVLQRIQLDDIACPKRHRPTGPLEVGHPHPKTVRPTSAACR